MATFKILIDPSATTYGLEITQFHKALREGFLHYYTANANMVFEFVSSGKANVYVRTKEIYLGRGQHARGRQEKSFLYLHNGYVSAGHSVNRPDAFNWQAIPSYASASSIIAHEFGHYIWGSSHSSDTNCLMHINANAPDLCPGEKANLIRKYGKPITPPPPPIPAGIEDVNKDGLVTPADALAVINNLAEKGAHPLTPGEENLDVNKDGYITPADALQIINCLNK